MAAGLADLPVVPKAGCESEKSSADARAEADQCAGPWRSSPSWPLAGPKHRLDPLADATEPAEARLFVLASGLRKLAPRSAIHASNLAPANPLSAMTVWPASGTRSSISLATSRSEALAGASSKAIGVPSAAQSK